MACEKSVHADIGFRAPATDSPLCSPAVPPPRDTAADHAKQSAIVSDHRRLQAAPRYFVASNVLAHLPRVGCHAAPWEAPTYSGEATFACRRWHMLGQIAVPTPWFTDHGGRCLDGIRRVFSLTTLWAKRPHRSNVGRTAAHKSPSISPRLANGTCTTGRKRREG